MNMQMFSMNSDCGNDVWPGGCTARDLYSNSPWSKPGFADPDPWSKQGFADPDPWSKSGLQIRIPGQNQGLWTRIPI